LGPKTGSSFVVKKNYMYAPNCQRNPSTECSTSWENFVFVSTCFMCYTQHLLMEQKKT